MPKINLETDNLSFSQKLWKNLAKDILNPWIPKSPTLLKRKFVNFKLDFNTVSFLNKKQKKTKFILVHPFLVPSEMHPLELINVLLHGYF